MVKVKICGITNPGDARMVVESGADALGFVFAPSPRQISAYKARNIIKRLPPFVTPVGVFVNEDIKKVLDIAAYTGLKAIQLHGMESPRYVEDMMGCTLISPSIDERGKALHHKGAGQSSVPNWYRGEGGIHPNPILPSNQKMADFQHQGGGNFVSRQFWVIKAFRIRTKRDLTRLSAYGANAFLLDSYERGRLGGTGKTFKWELAREARKLGTIILAGGLNLENIQTAIRAVRPYGVDVSSGVESSPGRKDRQLVREFVRLAKYCEI